MQAQKKLVSAFNTNLFFVDPVTREFSPEWRRLKIACPLDELPDFALLKPARDILWNPEQHAAHPFRDPDSDCLLNFG